MEMKKRCVFVFVIILNALTISTNAQDTNNSTNNPPYLQDSVISKPIEVKDIKGTTFDPDGRTVYFVDYSRRDVRPILFSIYKNGKWSLPDTITSTKKLKCSDPFMSLDGTKLFYSDFTTMPPKIKVIEKKDDQWGEPRRLNDLISFPETVEWQIYPTFSNNGTLYFAGGAGDIYKSLLIDGKYSEPELLAGEVNTSQNPEWDPIVSRDESYIIFCSKRADTKGDADLYISFNNNGKWNSAINLGPDINSDRYDGWPGISPDGKYLFYISGKSGVLEVYQVDLKPLLDSFQKK